MTREQYDATDDRVYDVSDVTASATGDRRHARRERARTPTDTLTVAFAEPQSGQVTVTYDYDVDGTVAQTADGLEVRWPVVQGFDLPDRPRHRAVERSGRDLALLPGRVPGLEPPVHDVTARRRAPRRP